MKTIYFIFCIIFLFSCETGGDKTPAPSSDTTTKKSETTKPPVIPPDITSGLGGILSNPALCIPPLGVDTSKVTMSVEIRGAKYNPTSNFFCIIPNIFLGGIKQFWINGSTPPAQRVITLRFPIDIEVGKYRLQQNSVYDAFYVPSDAVNFNVDFGELVIKKHDKTNKIIQGTFDFSATNLTSPAQSFMDFKNGRFTLKY